MKTAIVILMLTLSAYADTNVTWTWDAPTNYVGGTALPASAITGYRVTWGSGNWTNALNVSANELTVWYSSPGTYWHRAATVAGGVTGAACDAVTWVWVAEPDKPRNMRRK